MLSQICLLGSSVRAWLVVFVVECSAPKLSGMGLRAFVWAAENSILGPPLLNNILTTNKTAEVHSNPIPILQNSDIFPLLDNLFSGGHPSGTSQLWAKTIEISEGKGRACSDSVKLAFTFAMMAFWGILLRLGWKACVKILLHTL